MRSGSSPGGLRPAGARTRGGGRARRCRRGPGVVGPAAEFLGRGCSMEGALCGPISCWPVGFDLDVLVVGLLPRLRVGTARTTICAAVCCDGDGDAGAAGAAASHDTLVVLVAPASSSSTSLLLPMPVACMPFSARSSWRRGCGLSMRPDLFAWFPANQCCLRVFGVNLSCAMARIHREKRNSSECVEQHGGGTYR